MKFCFVSPVALRYMNKVPAPFRHPVDVFSSFCPVVWQHFARHCRNENFCFGFNGHLMNIRAIGNIFRSFGILYQDKSGNSVCN
jgi:hypothetical protein